MKTFLRSFLKPLSFIPALCMLVIIFGFSAQEGDSSSAISFKVSRKVVTVADDITGRDWDENQINHYAERIHYYIRKAGHIIEYFLLAASIVLPLYVVFKLRGFALIFAVGSICVLIACGDEYHQSFVSGRTASYKDVLIDSIGIITGIIFTQIICFIGRKTVFSPLAKK